MIRFELEGAPNAESIYDETGTRFQWSDHILSCTGSFDIHVRRNEVENGHVVICTSALMIEVFTTDSLAKIIIQSLDGRSSKTIKEWTDLDVQKYLHKVLVKGELPKIRNKSKSRNVGVHKQITKKDSKPIQSENISSLSKTGFFSKLISFIKK